MREWEREGGRGIEREREMLIGQAIFSPKVSNSQIRRLYSRFAHLDKKSKGYLV